LSFLELKLHSVKLRVRDVVLALWASESVSEITLSEGIHFSADSIVSALAHSKLGKYAYNFLMSLLMKSTELEIPDVTIKHLIPDEHLIPNSFSEV
jgi:hypothetical protein